MRQKESGNSVSVFLKWVDRYDDSAIVDQFVGIPFSPFGLLSVGWQGKTNRVTPQFLLSLVATLTVEQELLLIRFSEDRQEALRSDSTRLGLRTFEPINDSRGRPIVAVASIREQVAAFAPVFCDYWATHGGNWLVIGTHDPTASYEEVVEMAATRIPFSTQQAQLFQERSLSGITFDDNMLDLFVRKPI